MMNNCNRYSYIKKIIFISKFVASDCTTFNPFSIHISTNHLQISHLIKIIWSINHIFSITTTTSNILDCKLKLFKNFFQH